MALIDLLILHTQDLKAAYLEKTKEWAVSDFQWHTKVSKWREIEWCNHFNLTPEMKNKGTSMSFLGMPTDFYNTRLARVQASMKDKARRALRLGELAFINTELNAAEKHYQDSIEKLEARLLKKGIDNDNLEGLTVVSGRVGVNFEITIKVRDITVRAWTIIASGEIQRPHYRYLVK